MSQRNQKPSGRKLTQKQKQILKALGSQFALNRKNIAYIVHEQTGETYFYFGRTLYDAICGLEKRGLVERSKQGRVSFWRRTEAGTQALRNHQK